MKDRYREQALLLQGLWRFSYFYLVMQFMGRAQRPGIAEQKQIAHQLLEHQRFAGIQAADVQIPLILQLMQGFFFKHRTDFTVSRWRILR